MPRITVELLRKRAEHNEGIISTLEEISLHQEELEKIEVIGTLCRKLRILYLQNNIIEKIEDLTHMKELRYLNLALNNISKIEGLQSCEFLNKLDLTVNFVDFDTLEESIDHLKPLQHLRELYMLGNPCQSNWEMGFREFIIASLPQLEILDGKEIQRSDRIKALQVFGERQQYVRNEARELLAKKALEREQQIVEDETVIEVLGGEATDISEEHEKIGKKKSVMASTEKVPYTPHTRREMYLEMAEQKEEEEARRRENQPKERNTESEHEEALRKAREQEERADGSIRQCNEGKWEFRLKDEILDIILEVDLPRFLDTSLVDVDVHPSYVSLVAKNKVLRLKFPELVHSDAGKAERSKVSGTLRLTLPKAHVTPTQQLRAKLYREEKEKNQRDKSTRTRSTSTTRTTARQSKISDELLEAANNASPAGQRGGAVNIRGLVKQENDDNNTPSRLQMTPLVTKTTRTPSEQVGPEGDLDEEVDNDAPPLLF
ncbi:U2 small nuclear ribonucleoprotein A' [Phytophthora palmivora]|uniref:U2 small nuclear ribonucleoprotein A n=1 Tax=Phytophthora palmivora TaxID=4796 RepID=A0A2P4YEU4_9STRA|nr:U2 small nuclear ribonucleoprotein A' [Phytophthora palmivora]